MGNFFNSLNRKRVRVTGGARGIGKGIAKKCLEEGAKVFITNLDKRVGLATEKELSLFGEIKSLQCDGTDKAQVDSMVKGIWKSEGPLDLVFSNSGSGSQHRVLEANPKEIQKLLATNFESAVNIAQCCLPLMIQEQTDAHICSLVQSIRSLCLRGTSPLDSLITEQRSTRCLLWPSGLDTIYRTRTSR